MNSLQTIMLIILFSVIACEHSEPLSESPPSNPERVSITPEQFKNAGMKIGQLDTLKFTRRVRATGIIDVPPENRAKINAYIGGYVKQVPLLIGNFVKKGDLLTVLENPDYVQMQQEYLEFAEQLQYLKADFERQKTLYEEKISSEKNYLKAESDYKKVLAGFQGLEKKLTMLGIDIRKARQGDFISSVNIYSPINGMVTNVMINLGSYVSPSDPIIEIVNLDHKHLELIIYEKDVLRVKEGQTIRYKTPESSSEWYTARVALIARSIDSKTRTVKIHAHLSAENETGFAVGMFVEAEIILEEIPLPALPESAIFELGEQKFALLLQDSTTSAINFKRQTITVGETENGYVPITTITGIPENAYFLTEGGFGLLRTENP
jgi:membrane fusion protein, heavy metal efflux system